MAHWCWGTAADFAIIIYFGVTRGSQNAGETLVPPIAGSASIPTLTPLWYGYTYRWVGLVTEGYSSRFRTT